MAAGPERPGEVGGKANAVGHDELVNHMIIDPCLRPTILVLRPSSLQLE